MVTAAMKTSEIEGETLSRPDVMSSLRHRRGLDTDRPVVRDRSAEGAAELMVTVRQTRACPKNWDFPTSAILSRILTAISTSRNL